MLVWAGVPSFGWVLSRVWFREDTQPSPLHQANGQPRVFQWRILSQVSLHAFPVSCAAETRSNAGTDSDICHEFPLNVFFFIKKTLLLYYSVFMLTLQHILLEKPACSEVARVSVSLVWRGTQNIWLSLCWLKMYRHCSDCWPSK